MMGVQLVVKGEGCRASALVSLDLSPLRLLDRSLRLRALGRGGGSSRLVDMRH